MKSETAPATPFLKNVTTQDLLKTFAVILMIIDHLGYYFFPEIRWLRVLGRLCVPIWFFLVGYSKSQRLPATFLLGAFILFLADLGMGRPLLPLNVLVSMCVIRIILTPLMQRMEEQPMLIYVLVILSCLLYLPSNVVLEYGTLGLSLAVIGYMVRRKEKYDANLILNAGFITLTSFCLNTQLGFSFDLGKMIFMDIASALIMAVLVYYLPKEHHYPRLDATHFLRVPLQLFGRYTLEIYVAHLLVFKIIQYGLQH